jgi:hypothetical protein
MLKRLLVVSLATFALLTSTASAGEYPPPPDSLVVSDSTVVPGQPITLTARTFEAGSPVTFTMFSAPIVLGTVNADANGVAVLTTSIPNVEPGVHRIEASGTGEDGLPLTVSTEMTVAGATPGGGGGDLPRTGSDSSLPMARIAVSLLGVGALLVFAARWRQSRSATLSV